MAGLLIRIMVNQLWYWCVGYRFNDANGYERLRDAVRWYKARRNRVR